MNKRRKILAAMLAAFMLLVPMVSTAQIDIKGGDEETSDLSGTWGTTQITDYQTGEYVPLGEGLWLLAGAAGLYLLVKSRKTRKATAVTAAALALTLGTTQCKKTEESVIPAGETISISFMAGNGAKSDIDVTTGRITWEDNDEVYVVYGGQLLSETPLVATPDPKNSVNANIKGTITTTVTIEGDNPSFTFYYVGSGVTFNKTNFTFDIHNQNGINAGHYMVGRTGAVVMKVEDGTYVPSEGGAKHFDPLTSVLRLNTSEFGANKTMTMDGGNNLMTINLAGDATPSYTAGSITFTSGDNVQISVIPTTAPGENENATLIFSGNGKVGSITVTNGIQPGHIYSKVINNAGYPITVEVIEGALSGLFSVSDTKKVFFSKGNLQCVKNGSTWDNSCTWRFAENQWGTVESQYQNVGDNYAEQNVIGLFGWGTSGYNYGASCYQPWLTDNTSTAYGPSSGNLTLDDCSDWGINIGDGKTWHTLTKDEWHYLINTRKVKGETGYGKTCVLATVENVYGLIIFHDDYIGVISNLTSIPDGCVFLPAAGYRDVTSGNNVTWVHDVASDGQYGPFGRYWSSSCSDTEGGAFNLFFGWNNQIYVSAGFDNSRYYGFSVRLVTEVPAER